jgi:hypothetical protein
MTAVTFKNTTGQRVYYYINNGRNDFGFLDHNQEVKSGNANELGDVTIVTFKLSENPNARTDWVNALGALTKNPVTLQDILDFYVIDSIDEI